MKNKRFNMYYLFSCVGVLIASYYPLSMGVRVFYDMLVNGSVLKENYPKYIIPYTPISIAIIIGVFLMPLLFRFLKKYSFVGGVTIATGIFFITEILFEQKIIVSTEGALAVLQDWQMFMCYIPVDSVHKTQTAVDILLGNYSPAFKVHFYVISLVLIFAILNCIYGFGQVVKSGEKKRIKALSVQSVCALIFLFLCILACFTAFWRDGNLTVSPLSAFLMSLFFILLGVTAGVFAGSFLLSKRRLFSLWIPSVIASAMTLLMYIGEAFLLNGHLYSFGNGFFFESIPVITLAPVDIIIVLLSGVITYIICCILNRKNVIAT